MVFAFPVLMSLVMGIVEFGQYFYIKHTFQAAVRDVARASILATAAAGDPAAAATRTLSFANVTFNSSWLTIQDVTSTPYTVTDVTTVAPGRVLLVKLQVNYDQIPNAYRPLYAMTGQGIKNGKAILAQCTMIRD